MKKELRDVPASVQVRLKTQAHKRGQDVRFIHQRYAAERLLYRVAHSPYQDRFVLRGAMLYAVWGGEAYRSTEDLDLLGYGPADLEAVRACFRELCELDVPDDGLRFDSENLEARPTGHERAYTGLELKIPMELKTARIRLKIDIGFGDEVVPEPERVEFPTLLDGSAIQIRAYSRESVVAEKVHAAVDLGDRNSRMKDFYDLLTLSRYFPFEGSKLTRAIAATFGKRGTQIAQPLPLGAAFFTGGDRPRRWRTYLEKHKLSAPRDFGAVGEAILAFLRPPYEAINAGGETRSWKPGEGWR